MNTVELQSYKRDVGFLPYNNTVKTEVIRIESEFYYLQPAQVSYTPKERDR